MRITRLPGGMLLSTAIAALAALATQKPLAAEPWSLVGCPPQGEANWKAFEHAVRTAAPGSQVYVPKPYPATARQVIGDFLYQYKSLQRDKRDPKTLPAGEAPLASGITNNTVTYDVVRVENWTTMRCGVEKRRDFYYLVRIFDIGSGTELSRAVLDHSGLLFMMSNLRQDQRAEAPDLQAARLPAAAEAIDRLNARYRIKGESPQYVATYGSIDCDFTTPCLAFRQAGRSFVVFKDEVFEIPAAGKRLHLVNGRDVGTPDKNAAFLAKLAPEQKLISLGGPEWTVANKVDPVALAQ